MTSGTNGRDGCGCIDASSTLASLVERSCQTSSDGQSGIMLTAAGPCVPYSYGSSSCLQHDFIHDPKCSLDVDGALEGGGAGYPAYCIHPWCYVDVQTCMQSDERSFRSGFFSENDGVHLHYSYTTCESSADDRVWYQGGQTLKSKTFTAAVPNYIQPYVFKRSPSGDILTVKGGEYYNNSVPYEGVMVNYIESLRHLANEDFNISYTYGSKSSRLLHPMSTFTAVVQDVKDGLVDLGVGPFWVTSERLEMTSFTLPIAYDEQFLVIPKPVTKDTLRHQTAKVFVPFSTGVWVLILAIITLTALLSVWFSDASSVAEKRYGKSVRQLKRAGLPKKKVYARLALDQFLSKGMFFCSAGVEQNESASLPYKILLFGFGFFILIVVSAYVANLAAFLTRQDADEYVGTVEVAIQKGLKICAHPVLKTELENAHPTADFIFSEAGHFNEYYGVLDDYNAKKCQVMAVSGFDTRNDIELMNMFCEKDLVFTKSVFMKNPVAFPIAPELGSSFSYLIYEGEKSHGVTLESMQVEYDAIQRRRTECDSLDFSAEDFEDGDLAQIKVGNLFAPIIIFVAFAVTAIALQIFYHWAVERGKPIHTLVGRTSTFFSRARNSLFQRAPFNEESNGDGNDAHLGQLAETAVAKDQSQSGKIGGFDECNSTHENEHIQSEQLADLYENSSAVIVRKRNRKC